MAAALYPSHNDASPTGVHGNVFPRALMNELDFHDTRYPSLAPVRSRSPQFSRPVEQTTTNLNSGLQGESNNDSGLTSGWAPEPSSSTSRSQLTRSPSRDPPPEATQTARSSSSQEPGRTTAVSYSIPPSSRRVVERYSLDDQQQPSTMDREPSRSRSGTPQPLQRNPSQELLSANNQPPSAPRHPALPAAGVGNSNQSNFAPPIMPLSASPAYNPPISPRQRVYPQQPTFVAQNNAPNGVNPSYAAPAPQPQEEVCVECAMRDQDMADVDVTSPGIWERESDVLFEELKQREAEEEATGIIKDPDGPPRPRAKGGALTEQNLRLWLSMNPREPSSRQQTLNNYIKSQRTLLEAEALAYARAMQEAKQLDNRMRDAYSQLRRSAYDTGSSAAPVDDSGGVKIKPPSSPAGPVHGHERSHSRDVTLLENGMIVEHVDVRKEEKEARERRRKEERRARKSSRSSVFMDGAPLMSTQSLTPQMENGAGLRTYYSQSNASRPMSVLTAPLDRPDIPRAQSQASFSDVHSMGSASPRRSVFFPARFWKDGFSSRDSLAPSGMSGSMVDMHVALQREGNYVGGPLAQSPADLSMARGSRMWEPTTDDLAPTESRHSRISEDKPKKKKKGLARILKLISKSSKQGSGPTDSQTSMRTEDDMPLAPPPPLSYLMNRGPGGASTPSLPSTTSQRVTSLSLSGMSPPTAPSSSLPSPTSSRPSGPEPDPSSEKKSSSNNQDSIDNENTIGRTPPLGFKNVHSVISEPDIRMRAAAQQQRSTLLPNVTNLPHVQATPYPMRPLSREKSLPPLPGEAQQRPFPTSSESRPRTMFTYDSRLPPPGTAPAHDFLPPQAPFRNADGPRRQSFGGMVSRPTLDSLIRGGDSRAPRMSFGPRYDEFGGSRHSLNVESATAPFKRKSRFSFASLLGKKPEKDLSRDYVAQPMPGMRHSGSDPQDDAQTLGYATSNSRHSAFSASPAARMSVTSRKAREELVTQDAEFVAYRYPSNDQSLDLLR